MEKEQRRLARATRIQYDIGKLRAAGGPARDLAESKLEAVASRFAYELEDGYSYGDLEEKIADLIAAYPQGVTREVGDEPAPARNTFTRAELRAMDPVKRLEVANEMAHAEREAQAAKDAKITTDLAPERLAQMTPSAKLALANDMQRFGVKPEPKAPSPEQLRKMDAARRLDAVNAQIEASRKNANALRKRLAQARKDCAGG
jgi:hypothetical protein